MPGRGERPGLMEREKGEERREKGAAELPLKKDTVPVQVKPPPTEPAPKVAPQGTKDTVPATPPAPSVDTMGQEQGPEGREQPKAATPEPAKPAAKLQLEIAHFATDSWQIQAADSARLLADAESLKAHPDVKLVVVGHCDPRASERYNKDLGVKRAKAVRDLLVGAGVDAARITVRSDGEKRPISTKPDEYWLDRRVEFELH
jgi:peptidoglycan-associated lipoprotein